MELYQLKTFLKVAELNNITRSSEELNTSQPTVSAHIKALEEELNIALFDRHPKGMELTENGRKIRTIAEDILGSVDSIIQLSEVLNKENHIDIHMATNTFPEVLKLNELLSLTSLRFPNVTFSFSYGNSADILADIRQKVFDCGFVYGKNKFQDIQIDLLQTIPLKLIAPYSWEDKITSMNFKEIASLPWILVNEDCPFIHEVNKVFKDFSNELNVTVRVDDENHILNLVQSGMGISIIPELTLNVPGKNSNIFVYDDVEMSIDLSFAYMKSKKDDPEIVMLKKLLSEIWK